MLLISVTGVFVLRFFHVYWLYVVAKLILSNWVKLQPESCCRSLTEPFSSQKMFAICKDYKKLKVFLNC